MKTTAQVWKGRPTVPHILNSEIDEEEGEFYDLSLLPPKDFLIPIGPP
jgi:hypothetical protein